MSRVLIVLALILFIANESRSQCDTLVINLKNGQVEKIAISQIQKIQFENVTSVEKQIGQSNALDFIGNYPNPFSEQTSIDFELVTAGIVEIVIYNNSGEQIQTMRCENCPAGKNTLQWNCLDKNGNKVPSGTYYYVISYDKEFRSNKKMLIIR